MCGIAGVVDADKDRAEHRVAALIRMQHHRGPDHSAAMYTRPFALGIARLGIIAPSDAGNQPLWSASGTIGTVFNGEIYNHREVARWLGIDDTHGSDGRVIPHLLEVHGSRELWRLRGMYAFAAADVQRQKILLARDPLGIKPLYWRRLSDGTVAFASELRALAAIAPRGPIRAAAVARFLHLGALGGDESPFDGIQAVPANTWIEIDASGERARGTIVGPDRLGGPLPLGAPETDAPLRTTLLDAVAVHLGADVPTALLLSSGIDSAAIAWAARELGSTLTCLTVAPGPRQGEAPGAAAIAAAFSHHHRVVTVGGDPLDIESFFGRMQRPSIDGLNTWIVCRAVRDHGFKVALSGLGGDEAFGGYSHFRQLPALQLLRALDRLPAGPRRWVDQQLDLLPARVPAKAKTLVALGGPRTVWDFDLLHRSVWPLERALAGTGLVDTVPDHVQPPDRLGDGCSSAALIRAEVDSYLSATLLPDADGFSMASSVELRVPFVDRCVLVAGLHAAEDGRVGKVRFARAIGDRRLLRAARGPKQGFTVGVQQKMNAGPLSAYVRALADPTAAVWSHIDPVIGRRVLESNSRRWAEIWALASLNAWLESLDTDKCDH